MSKSGVSGTFGVKGASVNVGKNGVYANTGIPGTGIYDRKRLDSAGNEINEIIEENSGENESIFIENPTPEQTQGMSKVFGGVLLVVAVLSFLLMLWLGFNVIGSIFMGICFLLGLVLIAPMPKQAEEPVQQGAAGEAEAQPENVKRKVKNKQTPSADKTIYTIEYADYEGKETRRDIEINSFLEENGKLSLYAYCYLRNEARQFVVDRIKSISIKGGDPIDDPQQFLTNKFHKQSAPLSYNTE